MNFHFCNFFGSTLCNYSSAHISALGSKVNNMVGSLYKVKVMLDNHNRISRINQLLKNINKSVNIGNMKSRSRLIKNIHRLARRSLCELGCEFYTLCLTTRKSSSRLTDLI